MPNINKIDIVQKLAEDDLTIYPLSALKNEASSYGIAIFQPLENVIADDTKVKNECIRSISEKYENFFSIEGVKDKALLLSPEYSCPWDLLERQLNYNFPKKGKLWVLGCESITIDELRVFISRNENILFIHENLEELDTDDRHFLDPIVMCFNAKKEENIFRKVVVIQFKRRPMVDHSLELEKDHLILGSKYYEIKNDEYSSRLITLICAESIDYDLELEPQKAYIIPHLQLNTDPYHSSFMDYRLDIFKRNKNIEIICVNWAKGFKINNGNESSYGGSAYYLHSDKIKDDDHRINYNHKKGVYYSYSIAQHYHRYTLNYEENVFYLKTNQILQDQTANINQSRFGIDAKKVFRWESDSWNECNNCDDKWQQKLNDLDYFNRVSFLSECSPMAKERFLNITTGVSLSKIKWYSPRNLKSFLFNSDEKPSKLSVFFNPNNLQNLNYVTNNINWLKRDILNANITYPSKFSDLESINEFTVNEDFNESHINITNGQSCATFIALGSDSKVNAERVYSNIANGIGSDQRKLIVWYEDDQREIQKYFEDKNKIDDDFTENKNSITNDRNGE